MVYYKATCTRRKHNAKVEEGEFPAVRTAKTKAQGYHLS
jgi:hypothetical protein